MEGTESKPAILLLADGSCYHGYAAGYTGTATGEICFNTGMTGYQEIFTDPSYYGQIMVNTNVHIGNYGAWKEDDESAGVKIAGLVCKNFTNLYSRKLTETSLQQYLEEHKLVAIHGVDTRSLVRHIRNKGAMNAIISSEEMDVDVLTRKLKEVPSMEGLELASRVSTAATYDLGDPDARYRVAVLDWGVKRNILRSLTERDCFVRVFPAASALDDLNDFQPDGYFLSNGPGDPGAMDYAVETCRALLQTGKPLFGICLGHQILARAIGLHTSKMHHGHRGANHPVKNVETGQCEITTQNHGFTVDRNSLSMATEKVRVTHVHLNDDSVAGIHLDEFPAFSVQYHPEASPGPHDSRYLFDHFIKLMQQEGKGQGATSHRFEALRY